VAYSTSCAEACRVCGGQAHDVGRAGQTTSKEESNIQGWVARTAALKRTWEKGQRNGGTHVEVRERAGATVMGGLE